MAKNNDKLSKANRDRKPDLSPKSSRPALIKGRRITESDAGYLTPNLVVVPMQILKKPEPVKRKKKRGKGD
ncbi:MAG TPA: hypothetical protein VND64_25390 [Pirellulales bacterium]|nr:hypothetical protein [Pirellulales bacterium]